MGTPFSPPTFSYRGASIESKENWISPSLLVLPDMLSKGYKNVCQLAIMMIYYGIEADEGGKKGFEGGKGQRRSVTVNGSEVLVGWKDG